MKLQGLRMRAAKLAAAADSLKRQSGVTTPFSLAFMTDEERTPKPECVARVLPEGAALILRHYADPKREALARRLAIICRARGVLILVAADIDLATAIKADGVHLPAWMLKNPVRPPADMVLSAACHNAGELGCAAEIGADAALLSPVFATTSHPGANHLGPTVFGRLAKNARLPALALGGVDAENASALAGPNVAGIAAISAFVGD